MLQNRRLVLRQSVERVNDDFGAALLVAWKNAETAALFHSGEIFLGLAHVGVDLVHTLLDSVQLLCFIVREENVKNPSYNSTQRLERDRATIWEIYCVASNH